MRAVGVWFGSPLAAGALTGGEFFGEVLLDGFADTRGHARLQVKFLEPFLVVGGEVFVTVDLSETASDVYHPVLDFEMEIGDLM